MGTHPIFESDFDCLTDDIGREIGFDQMYCIQFLLPVLLLPRPANPYLLLEHSMFLILYIFSAFLETRPCLICSLIFVGFITILCLNCQDGCVLFPFCNCDLGHSKQQSTKTKKRNKKLDDWEQKKQNSESRMMMRQKSLHRAGRKSIHFNLFTFGQTRNAALFIIF